jgi:hypothetical protein
VSILYSQCEDSANCLHCSEDNSTIHLKNFRLPCHQRDFSCVNCIYFFHTHPHPTTTEDCQKKGDVLNNCLRTVDGIDFLLLQKESQKRGIPSHLTSTTASPPYAMSWASASWGGTLCGSRAPTLPVSTQASKSLRRFCITSLTWVNWSSLMTGMFGHADEVTILKNTANPVENQVMQSRVIALHETLNTWLKNWGIPFQTFATTSLCTAMCSGHARRSAHHHQEG